MNTPADNRPLLSIVIPAYNEEATLSEIMARLLAVPEASEIVIVEDCSNDGTRATADRLAAEHLSEIFWRMVSGSKPLHQANQESKSVAGVARFPCKSSLTDIESARTNCNHELMFVFR